MKHEPEIVRLTLPHTLIVLLLLLACVVLAANKAEKHMKSATTPKAGTSFNASAISNTSIPASAINGETDNLPRSATAINRQSPPFFEPSPKWAIITDYIWYRESSCGRDAKAKPGIVGAAGERGEYQITPIWIKDIRRLAGVTVDPYNNAQCRWAIGVFYDHYAKPGMSRDQLYRLYNHGPGR